MTLYRASPCSSYISKLYAARWRTSFLLFCAYDQVGVGIVVPKRDIYPDVPDSASTDSKQTTIFAGGLAFLAGSFHIGP